MTPFRIELPDGLVLDGDLTTVALAFLMHEYAPVGQQAETVLRSLNESGVLGELLASVAGTDEPAPDGVGSEGDGELADELANPERYAHPTGYQEIGEDDGSGDQDG